jgi:predicted DCC family thiol-disulfide oxidoreductase YuxK
MDLVLYDGQCGLCDRTVQWLLKIDCRKVLTFAPLQGETAKTLSLPQSSSEALQTIIFISGFKTPQQIILYKSDAVLEILKCVGGLWGFFASLRMIPKGVRDSVYDWIARNRYAWFGKYESCKIPSPETRSRFLP